MRPSLMRGQQGGALLLPALPPRLKSGIALRVRRVLSGWCGGWEAECRGWAGMASSGSSGPEPVEAQQEEGV